MKRLYAPWRTRYTQHVSSNKEEVTDEAHCVFCTQFNEHNDTNHFILRRFANTIVMLNLYPYNAGHLLILPVEHQAQLCQLTPLVRNELMEVISISMNILSTTLKAQGINMGLNIGKAAGAGIPSHIHFHLIPRWFGDTNFFPLIANTKQISTDLQEIYKQLLPHFQEIDENMLNKKDSYEKK